MSNEILQVISAVTGEVHSPKRREKTAPAVTTQRPSGSPLAQLMSQKLRDANVQRRGRMIQQLEAAGVTNIDGWSLDALVRGRINRETGDRVYPNGDLNRGQRFSAEDGRYFGSSTQMPVTQLHQTGVIWSAAS